LDWRDYPSHLDIAKCVPDVGTANHFIAASSSITKGGEGSKNKAGGPLWESEARNSKLDPAIAGTSTSTKDRNLNVPNGDPGRRQRFGHLSFVLGLTAPLRGSAPETPAFCALPPQHDRRAPHAWPVPRDPDHESRDTNHGFMLLAQGVKCRGFGGGAPKAGPVLSTRVDPDSPAGPVRYSPQFREEPQKKTPLQEKKSRVWFSTLPVLRRPVSGLTAKGLESHDRERSSLTIDIQSPARAGEFAWKSIVSEAVQNG